MELRSIWTALILGAITGINGCATKHFTNAFQPNSPANGLNSTTNAFGQPKEPTGISKLFSDLHKGKDKDSQATHSISSFGNDATSLQTPATVSADLLIVAAEMGLAQQRYDLAVSYFERALQMEPDNLRASMGLAKAEAGRGNREKSNQILNELRAKFPDQSGLSNSDSHSVNPEPGKRKSGIRLVSFEIEDTAENQPPNRISVENIEEESIESSVYEIDSLKLSPEIQFRDPELSRRVANPFFGTQRKAITTKPSREPPRKLFDSAKKRQKIRAVKRQS